MSVRSHRPGTLGEPWNNEERDRRRHWVKRQHRRGNVSATLEDCPERQDHPRPARSLPKRDPELAVVMAIEAARS